MPKQVAQVPKPPEPAKPNPALTRTFSTKEQEHFVEEALALGAELGFSGEPHAELRGVRVSDACAYLVKIFHEVHQSALTPERDTPEAADVAEHLGVTDADEIALIEKAIDEAYKREEAEAPANPTAVPDKGVANMSANLEADVTSILKGKR